MKNLEIKKAGMKKRIHRNKLLIIVLLLITVSSTELFSQQEDKNIAELYINTADSFYSSNDILKAEVFLNKSLLYYKDSSDAYYLKSLIEEKKTGSKESVIADLKKALILRNWNIYSEEDAFFQLGIIYSKIKEYKKAVSTLYVIEGEKIDNEEYLDAYSNSLLNSGMFVTAAEILHAAVEKYPENAVFIKKLINTDNEYYESILLKILENNETYKYDADIILEVLKNTEDEGIKKELFEKIKNRTEEFPEIIIEKIRIEKTVSEDDIDSFFNSRGYEKLKLIKELKSVIKSDDIVKYFNKKLSGLSAIIHEDLNNDGLDEILFRIENGVLVWYREDYNQDGLNDFYIYYTEGKIETIEYKGNYLVKYYHYPLLESVIVNMESLDVYDFSSRNTLFNAAESGDLFGLPGLYRDFENRIKKILTKAVMKQKTPEGKNLKIMEYRKNERITLYSEMESNRVVSEGIIKDGKPLYMERDNNDGSSFETKEIYKNGILEKILYDGNNDGIYELSVEGSRKSWDYNNDGIYETYEIRDGDTVYRGYSTGFDGIYDVEEKRIDGKIVSVRRGDDWFDVVFDKKNNIYWVNKMINNIVIEKPEKNSYINVNNLQIYIYKIADNYYAEVLN